MYLSTILLLYLHLLLLLIYLLLLTYLLLLIYLFLLLLLLLLLLVAQQNILDLFDTQLKFSRYSRSRFQSKPTPHILQRYLAPRRLLVPPTIEHLRQLQCHRLTLRSIRPARNPYLTLFFESKHSQVEQPLPDSQIGQNDPNIADFIGVPGLEVEASLVFEGTIHGELADLGPRDLLLYLLQMTLVEIYNRNRCTSALAQHVLQVEQSDPLVEIGIEVGELQLEVVETQNE